MGEQLYALAFRKHPYRWPTIGYMRDIDGFTTKDCRTFYRTYYAPNNAVLVLVGDFDEEECLALIQAHYGGISATRLPKERVVTEPPQRRERRRTMRFDTEVERLALGYRGPAFATFDWVVLAVLSEVLFGGRSARLIAKLVVEQELVTSLWGAPTPFEQPSLYEIWATLRPGASTVEVEAVIDEELNRLRREPISQIELDRVKNKLELDFFEELETAGGKAEQIGFYEVVAGGAEGIFERLEAYRRVNVDDVRSVARRYLKKGARSVVRVIPQTRGVT
jgi:zinc protease